MELSWLITAVLGIIIIYFIYRLFSMKSNYWEQRGVNNIELSLIETILNTISMKKEFREATLDLYKYFNGQKIGGYHQFFTPTLMVRDPELINHVLIKDFSHFENRGLPTKGAHGLFDLGLSNLTGDKWRNVRHRLTPTFTSGKLKMMFEPIKECSEEVVQYIDSKPEQDFDARDLMLRYILNVTGSVAFGLKLDTLNEKDKLSEEFFKYSSSFFKPSGMFVIKFIISVFKPRIREILKYSLVDKKVEDFFRVLTHDVIKHRENTGTRRNDFLQLLLDLKKKESKHEGNSDVTNENGPIYSEDKELLDQLKNTPVGSHEPSKSDLFTEEFISSQTFFFISGGSETTATALSLVLYELAVNPDLQKKVQDEINSVLTFQEFNYEAVAKLTYLEQFINETFRFFPNAVTLMRFCNRDYKIPGTETVVEKGTAVTIPVYGLHMDPQYFPDPEKFNPDHFKDMNTIPKGVYLPFGGGPRMCIAMRLAFLKMKIFLATLLLNYNVILSEKTNVPLKMVKKSILIRIEGGVWVKFEKRNK